MFTKYQRGLRPSTRHVLQRSAFSTLLVEKQSKYILVGESFSGNLLGKELKQNHFAIDGFKPKGKSPYAWLADLTDFPLAQYAEHALFQFGFGLEDY